MTSKMPTEQPEIEIVKLNEDSSLSIWIPFSFRQQLYPLTANRKAPAEGDFFFIGYTIRCLDENTSLLMLILERQQNGIPNGELVCDANFVFSDEESRKNIILLTSLEKNDVTSIN